MQRCPGIDPLKQAFTSHDTLLFLLFFLLALLLFPLLLFSPKFQQVPVPLLVPPRLFALGPWDQEDQETKHRPTDASRRQRRPSRHATLGPLDYILRRAKDAY